MNDLVAILIAAVLVNHFVLVRFPAFFPLPEAAPLRAAALATIPVLVLSAAMAWLSETWLLIPYGLADLRLLNLVVIITAIASLMTAVLGRAKPALRSAMDGAPSVLIINATMLGIALLVTRKPTSLASTVAWSAAAGLGFALLMALFGDLRERLNAGEVPAPFRGPAIGLVTAGLVSLGVAGLSGMLRG
jgi:electron transport complex protein RnfA